MTPSSGSYSAIHGAGDAEDLKLTVVEPIPGAVQYSNMVLTLESEGRVLKLTLDWIDEVDRSVTRTRRVMWDLPFSANVHYIDAVFRHGEFRADVYRPKSDGSWRRMVVSGVSIAANPSGPARVEVQPKSSPAEYQCHIVPSRFPENCRVYLQKSTELRFVFEHEEVSYENGIKTITDIVTTRYIDLPAPVPSGTIYFSAPATVYVLKAPVLPSPSQIQILHLH